MSHGIYFTRLWWHRGSGIAKLHGKQVALTDPPILAGEHADEVDYTPEAGFRLIRRRGGRLEDMTAAEIRDADALLHRLVEGA